jgi:hypothetical protein
MCFLWGGCGLSQVVRVGQWAAPAGLRGLLKSPPRHAGQAMPTLRATWFNPYRKPLGYYNCHRISFSVECGLISNVTFVKFAPNSKLQTKTFIRLSIRSRKALSNCFKV